MGGADIEGATPEPPWKEGAGGPQLWSEREAAGDSGHPKEEGSGGLDFWVSVQGLLWTTAFCQTPSSPQPTMAPSGVLLLLLVLPVAAALVTPGSCSGCGPLSLPMLAGLLAADAVVSLLIVAVVFVWACPHRRPTREDDKVYINMPGRG
ncbi:hematopoietic cell signal transducer isoform X1 [Ailuropoda melanoleuca]|uniref:hematopoietic cell signal transducer isoform X1 n=1 Tax=Ailuropoda melanoleuca TaxID=9646 RepID=UPI00059B31DF|nr:hematopoietic cell signal transducer isoform X1 [Ailuropoda melanoleuca]